MASPIPNSAERIPLNMPPSETTATQHIPRTARPKSSGEPKLLTSGAINGMLIEKKIAPRTPPIAEAIKPADKALLASPRLAICGPSMTVATEPPVPGIPNKTHVIVSEVVVTEAAPISIGKAILALNSKMNGNMRARAMEVMSLQNISGVPIVEDEGRLVGHIVMGTQMVEEKISHIKGFPKELAMLMKHLMISHHGQYEWGSPKRPKTLEANILYYLDDLDAKVSGIQEFMNRGEEGERWTAFHRMFDRFFYKGEEKEE